MLNRLPILTIADRNGIVAAGTVPDIAAAWLAIKHHIATYIPHGNDIQWLVEQGMVVHHRRTFPFALRTSAYAYTISYSTGFGHYTPYGSYSF